MQEEPPRNNYICIINEQQTIVYQNPMTFKQGD